MIALKLLQEFIDGNTNVVEYEICEKAIKEVRCDTVMAQLETRP